MTIHFFFKKNLKRHMFEIEGVYRITLKPTAYSLELTAGTMTNLSIN
jgi:hypothetical protein